MAASTTAASSPRGGGGGGTRPPREYPVISRREVEAMIAEGKTIVIVNQHVLKVDAWLPYHPGGEKAIMHMVGRDATDEVTW